MLLTLLTGLANSLVFSDLVLDVLYLEVLAKGFQTCRPGVTLLDLSVELTRIVCSVGHQVSL